LVSNGNIFLYAIFINLAYLRAIHYNSEPEWSPGNTIELSV